MTTPYLADFFIAELNVAWCLPSDGRYFSGVSPCREWSAVHGPIFIGSRPGASLLSLRAHLPKTQTPPHRCPQALRPGKCFIAIPTARQSRYSEGFFFFYHSTFHLGTGTAVASLTSLEIGKVFFFFPRLNAFPTMGTFFMKWCLSFIRARWTFFCDSSLFSFNICVEETSFQATPRPFLIDVLAQQTNTFLHIAISF